MRHFQRPLWIKIEKCSQLYTGKSHLIHAPSKCLLITSQLTFSPLVACGDFIIDSGSSCILFIFYKTDQSSAKQFISASGKIDYSTSAIFCKVCRWSKLALAGLDSTSSAIAFTMILSCFFSFPANTLSFSRTVKFILFFCLITERVCPSQLCLTGAVSPL